MMYIGCTSALIAALVLQGCDKEKPPKDKWLIEACKSTLEESKKVLDAALMLKILAKVDSIESRYASNTAVALLGLRVKHETFCSDATTYLRDRAESEDVVGTVKQVCENNKYFDALEYSLVVKGSFPFKLYIALAASCGALLVGLFVCFLNVKKQIKVLFCMPGLLGIIATSVLYGVYRFSLSATSDKVFKQ